MTTSKERMQAIAIFDQEVTTATDMLKADPTGWVAWIMYCQEVMDGTEQPDPERLKDLARFARLGLMLVRDRMDRMEET